MRESIVMDSSPCIVLATSGMMNGGPVMNYFQNWAHENRNSLCFVGYQQKVRLEGDYKKDSVKFQWLSMAKLKSSKSVIEMATIDGFSGHSDRRQLLEFIENMSPRPRMSSVTMVITSSAMN